MLMVIMLTTFPVNVFADPYEFKSNSVGNIMYSFDEYTGELVIQGRGKMQDFSSLNLPPWYYYKNRIASIKIEDGITYIGKCAFMDCICLTSVTVPDSVKEIGKMSFSGCTGLTYIEIPINVTKISEDAFKGCLDLTAVIVCNDWIKIDKNTLDSYEKVTDAIYPGDTKPG